MSLDPFSRQRKLLFFGIIAIVAFLLLAALIIKGSRYISFNPMSRPLDLSIPAMPAEKRRVNPELPPVAVCLAGQLRSFHLFPVRNSIIFHLLEPLRDAGYPVHTFFHVGEEDVSSPNDITELPNVFSAFGPASFSFFPVSDVCPISMCPNSRKTICPHTLIRGDQCMRQIEYYERRHNVSFSWFYRSRPDIILATNISLPTHLDRHVLYANMHIPETSEHAHEWIRAKFPQHSHIVQNPLGDLVHILSRDIAPVIFTASQAFHECELFNFNNGTIGPEVALTYWVVKHAVPYMSMPWLWILFREHTGPVCDNVAYIRTGNATIDQFMLHVCSSLKRTGVLPP